MALFGKDSKESEEKISEEEAAKKKAAADEAQIKIWQEEGLQKPEEPPAEKEPGEDFKAKSQEYYNQLVRLQAEFINFRKRAEREKSEAIRFGREAILERMIGLHDILESALKHSQSAKDIEGLKKGFEMVVSEFARFLKSEGAESLNTVGETFDPHQHEAVEQVETVKEDQNNIVLEELQKGYRVNGRLLRPARVKVAKFRETKEKE